jgi:hypothetical protein
MRSALHYPASTSTSSAGFGERHRPMRLDGANRARLPTRQVVAFRGIFDDIFYAHLEPSTSRRWAGDRTPGLRVHSETESLGPIWLGVNP